MRTRSYSLAIALLVVVWVLTLFIAVPGLKGPDTVSSATVAPPKISTISPTSGKPGASITVTGTVFGTSRGTSSVMFGTKKASSYVSWSSGKIVVKVPTGVWGSQHLTVKAAGGTSNYKVFHIVPKITSRSPSSGGPGAIVTINGSAFGSTRGTSSVWFGAKKVTAYSSWINTTIKAKLPSGLSGSARIKVVVNGGGISNLMSFTAL